MTADEELAAIRRLCEIHLTANEWDTTYDLVSRLTTLAFPEGAAHVWFERWQKASRLLKELGVSDEDRAAIVVPPPDDTT